jgi:hypothetical protein
MAKKYEHDHRGRNSLRDIHEDPRGISGGSGRTSSVKSKQRITWVRWFLKKKKSTGAQLGERLCNKYFDEFTELQEWRVGGKKRK